MNQMAKPGFTHISSGKLNLQTQLVDGRSVNDNVFAAVQIAVIQVDSSGTVQPETGRLKALK